MHGCLAPTLSGNWNNFLHKRISFMLPDLYCLKTKSHSATQDVTLS
jgi:hypothetical protein